MQSFNSHEESYREHRTQRTSLFVSMLTLASLLIVAFMLATLCGGVMLQALAVVFAVGLIGLVHYFTWGRSMSAEAEAERENELRSYLEDDDWNVDGPINRRS